MELIPVKDFEFASPPAGAIVEWRKSGDVWAYALLSTGTVVRCPDYDAMSVATNVPSAKHLLKRVGYGAHWIDATALRGLAVASVAALDAERERAEKAADCVIEFAARYAAGDIETYQERRTREQRAEAHADGWIKWSDSTCYEIRKMVDFGDPALAMALLRRGIVVVFESSDARMWRLADPVTASLAMLADAAIDLVRSCNPKPQWRGCTLSTEQRWQWINAIGTRALDAIVDVRAIEREIWSGLLA